MEVSGQLHAPAALPRGKSPWYPLIPYFLSNEMSIVCSDLKVIGKEAVVAYLRLISWLSVGKAKERQGMSEI
jgi:hypothetical protein